MAVCVCVCVCVSVCVCWLCIGVNVSASIFCLISGEWLSTKLYLIFCVCVGYVCG